MKLNKIGAVAVLAFWLACAMLGYSLVGVPDWKQVAAAGLLALAAGLGVLQVNNT